MRRILRNSYKNVAGKEELFAKYLVDSISTLPKISNSISSLDKYSFEESKFSQDDKEEKEKKTRDKTWFDLNLANTKEHIMK